MMFKKACLTVGLSLTLIVASNAMAGGIITDGDAVFEVVDSTSLGAQYNFMPDGAAGADHMAESRWFAWLGGSMQALPLPTSETYDGGTATLSGQLQMFSYTLTIELVDGDVPGSATLTETLSMQNRSPISLPTSFYSFSDVDAGGTSTTDEAILDGDSLLATDALNGGWITVDYEMAGEFSLSGSFYQAGESSEIAAIFEDGTQTLDNSGLPFGLGDFASAQQWQGLAPLYRTSIITKTTTLGVPEPSTVLLLSLGAFAALRRRR